MIGRLYSGKVLDLDDEVSEGFYLYTVHAIDRAGLPREGPGWRHVPFPLDAGPGTSSIHAATNWGTTLAGQGMYDAVCVACGVYGAGRKSRPGDSCALMSGSIAVVWFRRELTSEALREVHAQPAGPILACLKELARTFVVGEAVYHAR